MTVKVMFLARRRVTGSSGATVGPETRDAIRWPDEFAASTSPVVWP